MGLEWPNMSDDPHDVPKEWRNMLIGKKLGEVNDATTFARKDLPPLHRIWEPDTMGTDDWKPSRLNVHVDEDGYIFKLVRG